MNAAGGNFANNLGMLRADAADGVIDGVIGGTDYSAQIGDIDLTLQDGSGGSVTGSDLTTDNTNVTCFCAGSLIETARGQVPVEALVPGDLVRTADYGLKPLRLNLSSVVTTARMHETDFLRPVRIPQGALGAGVPERDLLVSRQHKMLVRSEVAQRMFGEDEVLVAAIRLVGHAGIDVVQPDGGVTYHHLVFDSHQIIFAEGAPSESFYPGDVAMAALSPAARLEFTALFPGFRMGQTDWRFARPVPDRKRQKRLVARVCSNGKPFLNAPTPIEHASVM